MMKIPTLFRRDPDDMKRVLPEVHPDCQWVLDGRGEATRKLDGTCTMFDGERWWARREVKPGKTPPADFRPVQHDPTTGKTVGWEPMAQSAFAKYHAEAVQNAGAPGVPWPIGTYELFGPKINGNPEGCGKHLLHRHQRTPGGSAVVQLVPDAPRDFEGLRTFLADFPHEGIVWHWEQPDGSVKMAKLKKRDFAAEGGRR